MKHLEHNGKVTLTKLTQLESPDREPAKGDVPAVVLDVETTGLNSDRDEVIQIAMRPFFVSPTTGEVSGVKKSIEYFQEPSKPLDPIITQITGFVDSDLKGKSIPWDKVAAILSKCQFVICHNASFDRQWVDKAIANSGHTVPSDIIWCCSMSQVDWSNVCRASKALEVLCAWHGFYYDSHNATADVDATLHLLRKEDYMKTMLGNAIESDYHVFAAGSLREENPLLKQRRYRWNPDLVVWWKSVNNVNEAEIESAWLSENLQKCEPQYFEIEAHHRFTP
jgi:DNA polymerase-3 subunit epsilon